MEKTLLFGYYHLFNLFFIIVFHSIVIYSLVQITCVKINSMFSRRILSFRAINNLSQSVAYIETHFARLWNKESYGGLSIARIRNVLLQNKTRTLRLNLLQTYIGFNLIYLCSVIPMMIIVRIIYPCNKVVFSVFGFWYSGGEIHISSQIRIRFVVFPLESFGYNIVPIAIDYQMCYDRVVLPPKVPLLCPTSCTKQSSATVSSTNKVSAAPSVYPIIRVQVVSFERLVSFGTTTYAQIL